MQRYRICLIMPNKSRVSYSNTKYMGVIFSLYSVAWWRMPATKQLKPIQWSRESGLRYRRNFLHEDKLGRRRPSSCCWGCELRCQVSCYESYRITTLIIDPAGTLPVSALDWGGKRQRWLPKWWWLFGDCMSSAIPSWWLLETASPPVWDRRWL